MNLQEWRVILLKKYQENRDQREKLIIRLKKINDSIQRMEEELKELDKVKE